MLQAGTWDLGLIRSPAVACHLQNVAVTFEVTKQRKLFVLGLFCENVTQTCQNMLPKASYMWHQAAEITPSSQTARREVSGFKCHKIIFGRKASS